MRDERLAILSRWNVNLCVHHSYLFAEHDTILLYADIAEGVMRRYPRLASADVTFEAAA